MPRARPHAKTRRGCSQCKARKVKCDEKGPSCKNCTWRSQQCSLIWTTPTPFISKLRSPPTSASPSSGSQLGGTSTNVAFNFPGMKLDTLDIELFHLYTISTSASLAPSKAPELWSIEFPRLALAHPFLIHGLLANSALHLAHLDPQRHDKLALRAARHEALVLPHFRKSLSGITKKNCHAVFAFSSVVTSYALASFDPSESRYLIPNDDSCIPNWINIIRGSHALLYKHWAWLAECPFAPVLERTKSAIDNANNPFDRHIISLLPLFSPPRPISAEEEEVLAICKQAFDELRRSWALPYSACKTVDYKTAATIWPGTITLQFIQLLRESRPEALVILAHYCVLLNEVENCWYYNRLAQQLVRAVRQRLSVEWWAWMEWPWDQVSVSSDRET